MSNSFSKVIIGVMGPANTTPEISNNSYQLGKLLAENDFIVLTGGRNCGVMDLALKGAKSSNGLTIGILKDDNLGGMSKYVDIPIITGLGSARNNINVLTSNIIVACGIGSGTTSEIALALKADKQVILLNGTKLSNDFFNSLKPNNISIANNPKHVVEIILNLLNKKL